MESKLSQTERDLGELQNSFLELKRSHERETDALQKAVNALMGGESRLFQSAKEILNSPVATSNYDFTGDNEGAGLSSESGIVNGRAKKIGGRKRQGPSFIDLLFQGNFTSFPISINSSCLSPAISSSAMSEPSSSSSSS